MNAGSPRTRARTRKQRCYELAYKGHTQAPEWTLVHGTLEGWIGHAWLECDGQVYDPVHDKFYTVAAYRREHRAKAKKRYNAEIEIAENMLRYGTYGPWGTDPGISTTAA